jgi:hypothetical protein
MHELVPVSGGAVMLADDGAFDSFAQADVFVLLVDCFRMRVEDEIKFKGNLMGIMDE